LFYLLFFLWIFIALFFEILVGSFFYRPLKWILPMKKKITIIIIKNYCYKKYIVNYYVHFTFFFTRKNYSTGEETRLLLTNESLKCPAGHCKINLFPRNMNGSIFFIYKNSTFCISNRTNVWYLSNGKVFIGLLATPT
jgi:hypothetical protein